MSLFLRAWRVRVSVPSLFLLAFSLLGYFVRFRIFPFPQITPLLLLLLMLSTEMRVFIFFSELIQVDHIVFLLMLVMVMPPSSPLPILLLILLVLCVRVYVSSYVGCEQ